MNSLSTSASASPTAMRVEVIIEGRRFGDVTVWSQMVRSRVTIGSAPRCDIQIPDGYGRPSFHVLFSKDAEGLWQMHVAPGMRGTVTVPGYELILEKSDAPQTRSILWTIRGKVELGGGVQVCFQPREEPPPPRTGRQIERAARWAMRRWGIGLIIFGLFLLTLITGILVGYHLYG